MKVKFLGIIPVTKNQFIGIETFFFVFFLSLTVFFFSYSFPAYIDDPMLIFHAKYLKYAALIATFLIVIEAQYVLNAFIKDQKAIIQLQNQELINQKEEILRQKEEIESQRDLAEQQVEIITQQKKHITDSIVYASTIQRALLPEYLDILKDYEYFIFFRPKEIVSGDFYWFYKKSGRLIVVAADCTGHGVPGAFMSLLGITYLNEIMAKSSDDIMPNEILEQLREKVITAFRKKDQNSERKDGMDMAVYIIEPSRNKIHFAGANNGLYIIRHIDNDNFPEENDRIKISTENNYALIELKADRMPVGNYRHQKPFETISVKVLKDDTLYTFSDGYTDQLGGKYGRRFGSARFKKLLVSLEGLPMEERKEVLEQKIDNWIHKNPALNLSQIDDMLVVGLKI